VVDDAVCGAHIVNPWRKWNVFRIRIMESDGFKGVDLDGLDLVFQSHYSSSGKTSFHQKARKARAHLQVIASHFHTDRVSLDTPESSSQSEFGFKISGWDRSRRELESSTHKCSCAVKVYQRSLER
jgi:23S rRNA G2069 N7-methylase RlmK/C1962 C5-methylase RlmI